MGQPYVGEIRLVGFNFAPVGWMFCDGSVLAISGNETLFTLIGTTYGGDGQSTFALPDLRGRIPIHQGSGFILAQTGGAEQVTLSSTQIPAHSHPLLASTNTANTLNPQNNAISAPLTATPYFASTPSTPLSALAVSTVGGSQPHTNFQPYLCVNFIISL